MNHKKIIAIRRDESYSPGKVDKDKAILKAVADRVGADIIDEARLPETVEADVVFTMGRLPRTLHILRQLEADGATVINSVRAVEGCGRKRLDDLMRAENVPMPPLRGQMGYWVKRGDRATQGANDIIYCRDLAETELVKSNFRKRGIDDVVISTHIEGDQVKFYGVGNNFFKYFYEGKNANRYDFDGDYLCRVAQRLAKLVDIQVYGGDCIVDQQGHFYIIDFNDWPSFSRCRDEASEAIAKLMED